ncbi:MAG: hypothetical protein HOY79_09485 [Streptomyces sp.]|nr:hypothetical protein [Streptomyces sp.]
MSVKRRLLRCLRAPAAVVAGAPPNLTVTSGLSTGQVYLRATNVSANNPSSSMAHSADVTPSDGAFSLAVRPGYVYTVTTTTTTGQGKGTVQTRAPRSASPHTRSDPEVDRP